MIVPVDNLLWRGSRPEPINFVEIKNLFSAVISLEGPEEDAKEAKELNPVPVISESISFSEIYITGISQTKLIDILNKIKDAPVPVLVHCQHGEDRTGLIVAAYRVQINGWTKEAAWAEALSYGYRNWLNFGLNKTWKFVEAKC